MKKRIVFLLVISLLISVLAMGCAENPDTNATTPTEQVAAKLPKYVFLFIGDGMSYPQIQATNYYLTIQANNNKYPSVLKSQNNLCFMDFPVTGSAQTYDSSSFAPDSSSTATAIASGHKTYSGMLGKDLQESFPTIAEKLKAQKGYKIGIVTSVNINHATPGAFYAHQSSRSEYFKIGKDLVQSGFDYFAGGALRDATNSTADLYDMAA